MGRKPVGNDRVVGICCDGGLAITPIVGGDHRIVEENVLISA